MKQGKSAAATIAAAAIVFVSSATPSPAVLVNAGGISTETTTKSCPAAAECYVKFSVVPMAVKVARVSCNFYFPIGNQGIQVTGSEAGFYTGLKYYLATYLNTVGAFPSSYGANVTQFQFISDVMYGIPANGRPAIHVGYNQTTNATFNCTVSYTPAT